MHKRHIVKEVKPGSIAEEMEIAVGDEIVSINEIILFMMMTPLWRRTSEPATFCNLVDYFLRFVIYQTTKYLSMVLNIMLKLTVQENIRYPYW